MSEDPPSPPRSTGPRSDEKGSKPRPRPNRKDSTINRARDSLSSILDVLPGIFYLCTRDGRFLRWNRRFEEVSGFSTEEMLGARPMDFFDEQEKPAVESRIRAAFEFGFAEIEANLRTKSGTLIPYHFNGT